MSTKRSPPRRFLICNETHRWTSLSGLTLRIKWLTLDTICVLIPIFTNCAEMFRDRFEFALFNFALLGKKKHEWQGHDWFRLHTTSFEKAKRAFYYTNHEATHRKTVQFSLTQTLHWNFTISKVSRSQSLHRIVSAAVRYLAWCVPAVVSSFHPLLMTISLSDPSCYRRSLHCT